jgi:hypothetical protein
MDAGDLHTPRFEASVDMLTPVVDPGESLIGTSANEFSIESVAIAVEELTP